MPTIDSIETHLRRRASLRTVAAWLRTIFAIPILFIPGLVLGTIFWITANGFSHAHYPWSWFFFGLSALVAILGFAQEIRRGSDYLGDVARTTTPAPSMLDTGALMSPYPIGLIRVAMSPRMAAAGWVEIFLTGPRMFLNGFRHLRVVKRLASAKPDCCAQIMAHLLSAGTSAPIDKLASPAESRADLVVKLAWLSYFGWIQVSENLDRVILFSESREKLLEGS